MLKCILGMKLKSKQAAFMAINDEIELLHKNYQKADENLKELQPKEDELLNVYFEAIKRYMKATENKKDEKLKMKEAEKIYREICTKINWFESTKSYLNMKLESAIFSKEQLENEIEMLKKQLDQ